MKKPLLIVVVFVSVIACILIGTAIFRAMGIDVTALRAYQPTNDSSNDERYIAWITPIAKTVGLRYGIPWQAIVVQTANETGWGKSSLLRQYNNFGGIKAVGNQAFVRMLTDEYFNGQYETINAKFATFKSPYHGLVGYARFFHDNPRYSEALKYPRDPYRFIVEIKAAGYATAPNYVATLHNMLHEKFPRS